MISKIYIMRISLVIWLYAISEAFGKTKNKYIYSIWT